MVTLTGVACSVCETKANQAFVLGVSNTPVVVVTLTVELITVCGTKESRFSDSFITHNDSLASGILPERFIASMTE